MIYQPEYVKELLRKHIEQTADLKEEKLLRLALSLYETGELVDMTEEIKGPDLIIPDWRPSITEIIKRSGQARRKHLLKNMPVAAIWLGFIIMAGMLIWLMAGSHKIEFACGPDSSQGQLPGMNKCRLTLANGCTVTIDSGFMGFVAKQGNSSIEKVASGPLKYTTSAPSGRDEGKPMYNTVTTSHGAQYQVKLSDGSIVTLNAVSSIRFPVVFSDTARLVEVEGEVYFDVKSNSNIPFYVVTKNTTIKVSGTSFNVNTFSSATLSTLVSGSLEIMTCSDSAILRPGQQAVASCNRRENDSFSITLKIRSVDTTQVLSWQKGKRIYDKMDTRDFLNEMARWYDLELINIDCVPKGYFSGTVCYDTPIEEILKSIHGISFLQEGRRIIFCRS